MGVITPDGVVGKILAVYPGHFAGAAAGRQGQRRGRAARGHAHAGPGQGSGEPLLGMEYVSNDEKVTAGEAVLTSGQDRIFPKDLPVGTVVEVVSGPQDAVQQIRVQPAAHLDRLEEVLVLLTRQELISKKEPDAEHGARAALRRDRRRAARKQSTSPTNADQRRNSRCGGSRKIKREHHGQHRSLYRARAPHRSAQVLRRSGARRRFAGAGAGGVFARLYSLGQLSRIAAAGHALFRAQQAQSVVGAAAGHGHRACCRTV